MFITLIQNLYRKAKATRNLKSMNVRSESPNIKIEDKMEIANLSALETNYGLPLVTITFMITNLKALLGKTQVEYATVLERLNMAQNIDKTNSSITMGSSNKAALIKVNETRLEISVLNQQLFNISQNIRVIESILTTYKNKRETLSREFETALGLVIKKTSENT
jgi:ABC-type phosphate/phosphonate transport system ATPase subunit